MATTNEGFGILANQIHLSKDSFIKEVLRGIELLAVQAGKVLLTYRWSHARTRTVRELRLGHFRIVLDKNMNMAGLHLLQVWREQSRVLKLEFRDNLDAGYAEELERGNEWRIEILQIVRKAQETALKEPEQVETVQATSQDGEPLKLTKRVHRFMTGK